MKDEKKRIDLLLDKNAVEQLAKVDWDRLTQETSARLARSERAPTSASGSPTLFKIAAAIGATAAVAVLAVVLRTHKPSDSQPTEGRSSAANRGTASVQIVQASAESLVTVHIGPAERKAVKCDVEIIEDSSALGQDGSRSGWIIITMPRPVLADNGPGEDQLDLIHLL